ncbi:MAG: VOC family protein, partial [Hyphomicrobiaceae bacterium]
MTSHGIFYWNEFLTNDVEAAKTFFAESIGWTYDGTDMGTMTYWVAMHEGKPVGGIMKMPSEIPEGTPPHWMSYLAVDDVDARLEKAKAAGGTVLHEPFDVP